jgi:hypothetical protein
MNYSIKISNKSINNYLIIRDWDFWDYSLLICLIFGSIGNFLSILVMNTKELKNTNASLFVSLYILIIIIIICF